MQHRHYARTMVFQRPQNTLFKIVMGPGLAWKKWTTVMKSLKDIVLDFQKKKFVFTTAMELGQKLENKTLKHLLIGIINALHIFFNY